MCLFDSAGSEDGMDALRESSITYAAGVAAEAHENQKLERLCRYITRPAISEKLLSISPQGRVRYELKTPWRYGTTHVEWDPVDFIAKLAAPVPPQRAARPLRSRDLPPATPLQG